MHVTKGGVSLHVWMTPLFMLHGGAILSSGVKQTLRLDAICEPAPCVCVLDLLDRDLTKKRLTEGLKQASH